MRIRLDRLWLALTGALNKASKPPAVMADVRHYAPSAERNQQPIADVLSRFTPWSAVGEPADVLEIASGTGQHAAHLAARFP